MVSGEIFRDQLLEPLACVLTLVALLAVLVIHPATDVSRKRVFFSVMETCGMSANLLLRAWTNLAAPTNTQTAIFMTFCAFMAALNGHFSALAWQCRLARAVTWLVYGVTLTVEGGLNAPWQFGLAVSFLCGMVIGHALERERRSSFLQLRRSQAELEQTRQASAAALRIYDSMQQPASCRLPAMLWRGGVSVGGSRRRG